MIQSIFIGVALLVSFFGLLRNSVPIWDTSPLNFGATSFPTSLDSLINPSGTDSVATISHSGQHSNANDAIEALETKVGIGAFTPQTDTIFGGLNTGVSGWFTWATSTRMTATNFLATGSSTLQNFTGINATTTNSTSTTAFATTASSTSLFTSTLSGAGLSTCQTGNFLTWNNSIFGCEVGTQISLTVRSTTTTTSLSPPNVTIATTTSLTTGNTYLILSSFGGANMSGNDTSFGLFLKRPSVATTTLGRAWDDVGNAANAGTQMSVNAVYTAVATENVEIYVGNDSGFKNVWTSGYGSIIILQLTSI
jgi:hypothetical protein